MSLYLTKTVAYATKVEAFEKRGLKGHVSVRANEAGVYVISPTPISNVLRYDNMKEELEARRNGRSIVYTTTSKMSNVLSTFGPPMFQGPQLIVEMKSGGEVLNSFGMFEAATGRMGLYAGQPTVEQLRQIASLGIDYYTTVPAGNVNVSGYMAYIVAWRGVHAFFGVGGGASAGDMTVWISEEGGARVCGKEPIPPVTAEDGSLVSQGRPGKKAGGTIYLSETRFITGSTMSAAGVRVLDPSSNNAGFQGHIFPYFKEMLDADPDSTFAIFIRLFKFCIASDAEELSQSMVLYRRGFRYLSSSQAGKILQHIYFGMELAIQSGMKLHLIRDGSEYGGFALEGDVGLLVRNRVIAPLEDEDLLHQLQAINSHSAALQKIYDLLIVIGRTDGEYEEITIEDLKNRPRAIREMVQARSAEDINSIRTALNELLSDLKYSQNFWEISPENLVRFLSAMNSDQNMRDEPMYVHIDVLTNRSSTIFNYLSVFGGQAPSIYHGDTIKAICRVDQEDPNLVIVAGKRAVPHIPFVCKGIIAAGADWASVARSKTFKYKAPKPRRGGQVAGFSNVKDRDGVIANPHFDAFYTILRTWVHRDNIRVGGSRGNKRRGDDMEGLESTPPKKKAFTFI